ncbi:MAG: type I methionyl aminopeptidase [Candidatus Omnitrophica bacterium]|nr:type I methionyl aminopeptidase [Candidatus Omnitrophota bacterium]
MTFVIREPELSQIRDSGKVLKKVFEWVGKNILEGVSTLELDARIEKIILENQAKPAFKGYKGYPASICASVNSVVVHGIPSKKEVLRNGDIVSIDVGVYKNGFFTDAARTYPVGRISSEAEDLIEAARVSLKEGSEKAVAGNRLGDISNAVQTVIKKYGYKEVRSFVGHGIGKELHEEPEVPNWGEKGKGILLEEGLVIAIEPMVNMGTREVEILSDGWTVATKDRKISAHFENTVIVGRSKAEEIT